MTGWHLTIGYQYDGSDDEWEILRDIVEEVRQNPLPISEKAGVSQGDAAMYFGSPSAVTILEDRDDPSVMLLASGGGDGRKTKETLARAFVLMVLERMAELDININVKVA